MSKLTWLHLSDLHFKSSDHWDENIVLNALLRDIRECIDSQGLDLEFAVVSGDLAYSGAREEYAIVGKFFDKLLGVTNLKKSQLFVVPGNHDVDWKAITRGAKAIASSLDSREEIAEVITSEDDRRLLFRKFNHYADFVNGYFEGDLFFDDERYFFVKQLKIAERKVAVLGLNSALLSMSDEDRGRLVLSERQVRQALESSIKAELRLAIFHHPFDWSQEFDRNECEAMLTQDCDFILHGHLHRTGLLSMTTPDAGAMMIAAGACYESREYPNGYNFVQLDFEKGQGTVFLRRYSDERGGFWTKDVMTYPNVDNGTYTFALLSTAAVAPGKKKREIKPVPKARDVDADLLEANYLRRMLELCNALPLWVIDPKSVERTFQRTMDLLSVYVGLDTRTRVETDWVDVSDKGKRLSRDEISGLEREERWMTALEAAASERKMVLLGDPGGGKSTFANFLALCMAGERLEKDGKWLERLMPAWSHGPIIPVRVTLGEFAVCEHCDGTVEGLWNFISDTLAEDGLADFAPILWEHLLQGGVMVLLDGLDEVADPDERTAVRDAAANFAATYGHPENRYLVTCRGYAYQDPGWQLEGFADRTLSPLTEEQIDKLITSWYEEVCRRGWKSRAEAEDLTHRLQAATRRTDLMPLARNPLQLTMMTSLQFSWGRLPEDRVELYQEMVRLLLVRWQEARLGEDAGVSRLVSAGKLESALERVAFVAHHAQEGPEGPADIMEAQLRSVLKDCLEGSWDGAGELLTYIKERAGLLIERGPGIYTFPHRSYQEYLAGSYLAVQPDFPEQAAGLVRENPTQWREVVLWAVGIMARLKKMSHVSVDVASALCPQEAPGKNVSDKDWRSSSLAGEALLEIGLNEVRARERHTRVVTNVQNWLLALIERGVLNPVERAAAGNSLSKLGDPRFRPDAWYLPGDRMLGFVEVPAGPFLMGSDKKRDPEAYEDEMPQHEVNLPTYYISRYPVTVAQFGAFVEESGYEPQSKDGLKGIDNHPVVNVTWYDAIAYCKWLNDMLWTWDSTPEPLGKLLREGKIIGNPWRITLPSEAEWEKAARGNDGRIYPWGDKPDTNRTNYSKTRIGATSTVGCFPEGASPYGCLDMTGNVWEWTRSLWGKDFEIADFKYPYDIKDGREDSKGGNDVPRVLRGGAFGGDEWLMRCAFRRWDFPMFGLGDFGFRVVLSL